MMMMMILTMLMMIVCASIHYGLHLDLAHTRHRGCWSGEVDHDDEDGVDGEDDNALINN